jgi:serine phosphatase RsbU (regulator of sigma subunit)
VALALCALTPALAEAVQAAQSPQAAPPMPNLELLARIALGFLLASAGGASLVSAVAYGGPSRPSLISFGLFSFFYGSLLLLQAPAIVELVGLTGRTRAYTILWISYFVPSLGLLHAEYARGRGWMSFIRRLWQLGLLLAVAFIVVDVMSERPGKLFWLYQIFLLVSMVALLPHVIFFRTDDLVDRMARILGTGTLAITLIIDMVSRYFSWPLNYDTYGITIYVLAQGAVTARQFFKDQREFTAVERELETARTIQTSILPSDVPRFDGVRIAVRNLPAHSVAGDLYDFMRLDDTHLGVLVADVAGHGVSAALIASMTTVAFASQRSHAADTARTLAEMNRVLCGHFETRYITAAYVFIDTAHRRLSYSLGGHPPPLLWRARTQSLEKLANGSLVLGMLEAATYDASEVALEHGDRLILYTDGLTEIEHKNHTGEFFGDRELSAFIASHTGSTADAFVDGLIDHLLVWSGKGAGSGRARFDDDLTVVVVDFI